MEWIPVTEKLPEENQDVLVTNGEIIAIAEYEHGFFMDAWIASEFDNTREDITHWMPLPPLPTE